MRFLGELADPRAGAPRGARSMRDPYSDATTTSPPRAKSYVDLMARALLR